MKFFKSDSPYTLLSGKKKEKHFQDSTSDEEEMAFLSPHSPLSETGERFCDLANCTRTKTETSSRKMPIILTLLNTIMFGISLLLFIQTFRPYHTEMNAMLQKTSFYSPVLRRLKIPTMVKKVNGTLFEPLNQELGIGRAYPNPEADARWLEIELTRTIPITAEDVRRLGKDPETVAKFEDSYWGLGDNAYMAQVDVFHQLHCLNTLRKLAYPKYYQLPGEDERDEMFYIHHNHCVDILTQNLMCTGNVDLITMQWMETQSHPFPDFSINHQCRDFDTIMSWRYENSVDIDKWIEMKKPENVTQVPAPDKYYELWGTPKPGEEAKSMLHEHGHEHEHEKGYGHEN